MTKVFEEFVVMEKKYDCMVLLNPIKLDNKVKYVIYTLIPVLRNSSIIIYYANSMSDVSFLLLRNKMAC